MMQSYQALIIIVTMTLLPLIFLTPMIIHEFLERKQQKMFQFLLEFKPRNFAFSQSSASVNGRFKKEKQLSQSVNRGREEIRAILSARNCLSPRELLSLLCTSSTQHSSFCTAQRNDEGTMRSCRKSEKIDMKNLSRMHSSDISSSESDSIAKKQSTITAKFKISLLDRSINSKKAMELEESSFLSSAAKSFSGSGSGSGSENSFESKY